MGRFTSPTRGSYRHLPEDDAPLKSNAFEAFDRQDARISEGQLQHKQIAER